MQRAQSAIVRLKLGNAETVTMYEAAAAAAARLRSMQVCAVWASSRLSSRRRDLKTMHLLQRTFCSYTCMRGVVVLP